MTCMTHFDVLRHDVEVDLVEKQTTRYCAGMETDRALAVVSQPDVRIGRLLTVVPRHLQAPVSRIQLRLRDRDCRQVRVVARYCWAEQHLQTFSYF